MKYFKFLLGLALVCCGVGQARSQVLGLDEIQEHRVWPWITDFEPLKEWASASGLQYHVQYVRAETPSPLMTGYDAEDRSCVLIVNLSADLGLSSLDRRLILAHEVGHCEALRQGRQNINQPPTEAGEGMADIWALAWIAREAPIEFDKAYARLVEMRNLSKQLSHIYHTFAAMRVAYTRLRTEAHFDMDPTKFMLKILEDN